MILNVEKDLRDHTKVWRVFKNVYCKIKQADTNYMYCVMDNSFVKGKTM